ncbi:MULTISPECIES: enoyl-CoA hydratase/isomerase family protein [unclassified Pseudofrankia]|uniref:enoyl-CoA hydratase/isomerase family protein n=1 Tax=unclassified Pseudofrankia TaxID=2994372 RepID=UPI0008D9A8F8|nr:MULTISPECIES: enoyl-CoA hydratase/isomerase family protein [unclassified Pseudofrankia]MDT3445613.1 enoyl-CoA hydratase/isomerase family protein [Pseudofrankia sp. BMG5.37]OHV63538.1 hypothetical protein BCD48_38095 [Pseudofrankia sp. BMG5.36]
MHGDATHGDVDVVVKDRAVHIKLSNETVRNAMTPPMIRKIRRTLADLDGSEIVVVQGSGGHFCSGYSIGDLDASTDAHLLSGLFDDLERHPGAVIGAIEGGCAGAGLELALSCDIRIASTSAKFIVPPAALGVVYPIASVHRLVDAVGSGWARRMLLTAERVTADTATRIGLVSEAVAAAAVDDRVAELVERLSGLSPFSIARGKEFALAIRDGVVSGRQIKAVRGLDLTAESALTGPDFLEAQAARREKRRPVFGAARPLDAGPSGTG